ncbi:Endonuclease/exonuclease/phosphatase [Radiomyces spectabilis]|uniref:Endonuclease/exonuclease/phosphatase n=1 Tax=Radiomyces spectabilis TaxID=64574 RepID=UPI00221F561D|nr:Endonuclease/exonuclease/phosphatase [Radiomyces spectabilis]KAI8379717.1 Endonuclease/exonuclease/phosphatase [Radiomyces spectabilis]
METKQHALRFMTFNIRHDHGKDSPYEPFAAPPESPTEFSHEQPWAIRKWKIADTIILYSPDVVGLQEPIHHQLVDLEALLNEEYEWVGVGRNDGKEEGEYAAIFYKRECLSVENHKTIWLSETPEEVGSKGWDAHHPRVASQVMFKRLSDDSTFTVFNAHFDHMGNEARRNSSQLLLDLAKEVEGVVILMGDLNSPESDAAYKVLTGSAYEDMDKNATLRNLTQLNDAITQSFVRSTGRPVRTTENNITLPTHRVFRPSQILSRLQQNGETQQVHFNDTRYELVTPLTDKNHTARYAKLSGPYGDTNTFTSFGVGPEAGKGPTRIDYILTLNTAPVEVRQFAVLSNQFDDGLYISDHRPILAKLAW